MTIQPNDPAGLDERQQRIHERLKKAGDGPAAFFLDACRLVRLEPSLETTTHLVGHCIREIESALRDVLVPLSRDPHRVATNERLVEIRQLLAAAAISDDDPLAVRWQEIAVAEGGETHKAEIRTILAAVGFAESDVVAVNWLKLAGAKNSLRLHDRAHRSGLSARPVNAEFREFWSEIQTVLDAMLERFEARYLVYIEILKRLLEKDVPAVEDVATLKEAIPRTLVTHRFFFERLEAPGWFPALRRKGFFASPFPGYWPEAVYLRKIARALPQDVLNVMTAVTTDGLWTHMEFAQAAMELPAPLMAKWARHEAAWIRSQRVIGWTLPQKYGDVLVALIQAGELDSAMDLLSGLLSQPPGAETSSVFEEPPARLEWAAVQHLMEQVVPALETHAPLVAFDTFANLLASIIWGTNDDLAGIYDGSTLWRESIAHDRGLFVGRRNELVTAVRTMAVAAVRAGVATAMEIVTRLRERKLAIFERLALFTLAQFPAEAPDLVASELLSDLDRLRDDFDRREFGMLVAAGFPHLAPDDQWRVVKLICSGPDVESFRERAESRGFVVTEAHIQRHVLQWQTRFAEAVLEHAPTELRNQYTSWKEELANVVAALEPAPALRTIDQLREMRATGVIAYFRTIEPSQRPEHSRFDLGRDLQQLVAAAPTDYSNVSLEIRDLEPYLIHWFLYGLSQAVQQMHEIDWASVTGLLEFAVEQPIETTALFENSWAAVRKSAASMLERALNVSEPTIPRELVPRLWTVLTKLLDRDAGDEAVDIADSLAKTGSNAGHAGRKLRARRCGRRGLSARPWMRRTDASALQLEARTLFDAIVTADGSLVLHAALGKNLLYFLDIDETWLKANIDRVLPRDENQTLAWCAAWSGFLSEFRPSREEFEILRDHYDLAIRRLIAEQQDDSFVAQRIGQHLMDEYWSGLVTLDDPLITDFFQMAPGRIRGHALWYVLRGVDDIGAALPNDVRDRVAALWTWRVVAAENQPDRSEELSWYGYFFALGRFDEEWSVQTLLAVLRLGVRLEHHEIVERLAVYSGTEPDVAFECFRRLIALDQHRFLVDEESGRVIVRNALQSPKSQEEARAFVHSLGSEGQLQFADLLG